jgi:hypothetical protein
MSRRDYNSQGYNSSDRAEEGNEGVVDQLHSGERHHRLQIIPSPEVKQPQRTHADEELRELIRQLQRPVKKVPVTDDLPSAA